MWEILRCYSGGQKAKSKKECPGGSWWLVTVEQILDRSLYVLGSLSGTQRANQSKTEASERPEPCRPSSLIMGGSCGGDDYFIQ